MISRMEVLRELLFELDEVSRANDLKYSITGPQGVEMLKSNSMPKKFDYLTVTMTLGDIERFIDAVNGKVDGREVEYFLNNPNARGIQFRYCNNNTTCINVKEIGNHTNYGMYIKILPLNDLSLKNRSTERLKLMKKIWKGSKKTLLSSNSKNFLQMSLIKIYMFFIGSYKFGIRMYNLNKKLRGIDSWNNIRDCQKVGFGRAYYKVKSQWEVDDIIVDNHKIMFCNEVLEQKAEPLLRHITVMTNDIENTEIPYSEIMSSPDFPELAKAKNERDLYIRTVTKANQATKYIGTAWNTYLMSRNVVNLKNRYNDKRINKIKKLIKRKEIKRYYQFMNPYLKARKKWTKMGVPFIKIDELEDLITYAKKKFYNK